MCQTIATECPQISLRKLSTVYSGPLAHVLVEHDVRYRYAGATKDAGLCN